MHRFFLQKECLYKKHIKIEDTKILHQLLHVLRIKKNDQIICFFGDKKEYLTSIKEISKKQCMLDIINIQQKDIELKKPLILYQALPKKKEVWEQIVKQATEIGVSKIIPLMSSRTYAKYSPISLRTLNIIKEATEQSGRTVLPIIEDNTNITDLNLINLKNSLFLAGDSFDKKAENIFNFLLKQKKQYDFYGLFIGPEGGFSLDEIEFLKKQKVQIINLGKKILRMETAVTVSLGIVANYLNYVNYSMKFLK